MNIGLLYFSQTGNTRKIAEAMAGAFQEGTHTEAHDNAGAQ